MSDDLERMLKQELANLHRGHLEAAAPIIRQLGRLEAMKPPRPLYLDISQVDPAMLRMLGQYPRSQDDKTEGYADRMARLEREREQLLHLLRMVRSEAPDYLAEQIDRTLGEMAP
jgi:hypothetical protein